VLRIGTDAFDWTDLIESGAHLFPLSETMSHEAVSSGELELRGLRAIVTGSSSGIGRATAIELARAGCDVLVHTRAHVREAKIVADRVRELGRKSDILVCDLADPLTHEQLVANAWDAWGGVDIWFNNAGADVLTGAAARWTFEQKLDQLWRVDVVATMRLSRLVGRRMFDAAQGERHPAIVNMGWDQAEGGMSGDSGQMFASIKSAVMAFSRSLAKTLAPQVRVNCVAPGWIRTAWGSEATDCWQKRAAQESLLGRWGTAEDVAHAVRYLASPRSAFINGQVLVINGGFRSTSE
jgi:3-oxoacyl-[acyl-carrier protein] reductase